MRAFEDETMENDSVNEEDTSNQENTGKVDQTSKQSIAVSEEDLHEAKKKKTSLQTTAVYLSRRSLTDHRAYLRRALLPPRHLARIDR